MYKNILYIIIIRNYVIFKQKETLYGFLQYTYNCFKKTIKLSSNRGIIVYGDFK